MLPSAPLPVSSMLKAVTFGCGFLLTTAYSHADVRVLNQPGSSYSTLQAAVNSAADGDTLLIGGGSYSGFSVDGKGLKFVAAPGTQVIVNGVVAISNLPLGSSLRMDRMEIHRSASNSNQLDPALQLTQNQGEIRLHDTLVQGGDAQTFQVGSSYADGGHAVRSINCQDLAFLDCNLLGGEGGGLFSGFVGDGGIGGHGLWSTGSAVALYDTSLTGGLGGSAGTNGGDGGHGCFISGPGMFAAGCEFVGGDGGQATDFIVIAGGNGGTGLWVQSNTAARLLDNEYVLGLGGHSFLGANGLPGMPHFGEDGPLAEIQGTHRSLTAIESVISDGDDFHLVVRGVPGDTVYLAVGRVGQFEFSANPPGVRLVPFKQFQQAGPASLTSQGQGQSTGTVIGAGGMADIYLPSRDLTGGDWSDLIVQADIRQGASPVLKRIGGAVLLTSLDDEADMDCNFNGISDLFDIASGLEADCNGDQIPDSCFVNTDCNNNGVDDDIDVQCGVSADFNNNGILDECESPELYVDASAPAGGSGTQASPFKAVAPAFQLALSDWTIHIAPGNYVGASNKQLVFNGKNLHVIGTGGSSQVTLDLEGAGTAFWANSGTSSATIEGITIRNASTCGVRVTETSFLLMRDVVFKNCLANGSGGGLRSNGDTRMFDCSFVNNTAGGPGSTGGAIFSSGHLEAIRTNFNGNQADSGGAVYGTDSSSKEFSLCIFRSNTALVSGGAICDVQGTLRVDGSYFSQNSVSAGGGGAIWLGESGGLASGSAGAVIFSCTFVNNQGGNGTGEFEGGGAFYLAKTGYLYVRNSILWNNSAARGDQIRLNSDSGHQFNFDVDFSDLQGGLAGVDVIMGASVGGGNLIDLDPLFVNPGLGDYRLGAGSPCVDAGRDLSLAHDDYDLDGDGNTNEFIPFDLLGQDRQQDDPNVVDTGVGSFPVTDMGALER